MKKIFIIGILVVVLLAAGCISLPGQTSQPVSGGNQTVAGGHQEEGQPTTETAGGEGREGGGTVSKQISNLGEALAQSVPMECTATVTVPEQGVTGTSHYWIKSGNMRMETTTEGQTVVAIVKNEKVYVEVSAMGTIPGELNCAWIVFEPNKTPQEYSDISDDYRNPEGVRVECYPAVFGDEKFATPGRICTMDDLIPPAPELPPGYEACEGLSGQDLINCMQRIQQAQTG